MADDTGLEVDALGGAPGVRSARFAGEDATYVDNVMKLLDALCDLPEPEERIGALPHGRARAVSRRPRSHGRRLGRGSDRARAAGRQRVRLRPGVRAVRG